MPEKKSTEFDAGEVSGEKLAEKIKQQEAYLRKLDTYQKQLEEKRRTESDKKNLRAIKKIIEDEYKERIKNQEKLFELRQKQIEEEDDLEKKFALQRALEEERREAEARQRAKEAADNNAKQLEETGSKINKLLLSGASSLKNTLEGIMKSFIESQEAMNYGLIGTGRNLKEITTGLGDALGGTGLVKQENVYKNLSSLINQGILYNVEQRAFLQTIADDLGGVFDVTSGSLTRLINLQRQDLTANRMAIRSSLKEFLNQNYETSQYIKEGFQGVSDALFEAQAIMTSDSAMRLEATVQQWLGSLSSVGMSQQTVNQLAQAIGELGSGNLNALNSSSMQNLLVMGAARSGLSYADLLMEGVSGEAADALMKGIVSYMTEIGKTSGNVVRSEYARVFGLNVSDLVAASQVANPTQNGIVGDDINKLLSKFDNYVSTSQQFDNVLANFIYNWGSGVASSPDNYMMYRITDMLSQAASAFVGGISIETSLFGNGISTNLGDILNLAPLVTTIPSLLRSVGDAVGDIKNLGNIGFARLAERTPEGIDVFNRLSGEEARQQYIRASGQVTGFTRTEGLQTSGAMIIANTNTSDIVKSAKNSAVDYASENLIEQPEEYYDTTDIYKLLDFSTTTAFSEAFNTITTRINSINEGINGASGTNALLTNLTELISSSAETLNNSILSLPNYVFETSTSILSSANTVTIGNDLSYVQDIMLVSSVNIQNIYNLLYAYLANGGGAYESFQANTFATNTEINWNWAAGPQIPEGAPGL